MGETWLMMEIMIIESLCPYLLASGDDELILGHRNSEWCGYAPLLEEDIAFANLALDEIGHAAIWYTLLADLREENRETYPDELVFNRPAQDFRNATLFELPNGDWAFSMLRQYLFDLYETVRLAMLEESVYAPLAEAAKKISREEVYHRRHTSAWVRRLGLGTEESRRRMQAALDQAWPLAFQLFSEPEVNDVLVYSGYVPSGGHLQEAWREAATEFLESCQLNVPPDAAGKQIPRNQHTPYLNVLVDEMQSVVRLDPEASW
jgi:ring-1,2-phenylacetyl-CoA epoxidase subunit PaaC